MTSKLPTSALIHADVHASNEFQALLDKALSETFPASNLISLGSTARCAEACEAATKGDGRSLD